MMRDYHVRLESAVSRSFRCQRAADSLDIDTAKKAVHQLAVRADVETPFSVGLIVGASGSGKTTLAKRIYGEHALDTVLDLGRPVIEQFPAGWDYDRCAGALSGIGLTSVPCWIRPAATLSNGQRARAEAALQLARMDTDGVPPVIDEWTSVVDRTVAKAMSHCVQKYARRSNSRIVLVSCHYDVVDWLNPDWIIDCNTQSFIDRRGLWRSFQRDERLTFDVYEVARSTWPSFSKYHYLSEKLPGGDTFCYGLFHGDDQIGFTAYTNYVPRRPDQPLVVHGHRTVIHPDYVGLGIGIMLVNESARHLHATRDVRILGRFSSVPLHRLMLRDPYWRYRGVNRPIGRFQKVKIGSMERGTGSIRRNVTLYLYEYAPDGDGNVQHGKSGQRLTRKRTRR